MHIVNILLYNLYFLFSLITVFSDGFYITENPGNMRTQSRGKNPPYTPAEGGGSRMLRGLMLRMKFFF